MSVSVTVKCVMCGSKRQIGLDEETRFSVPMCPDCFSPMVAESAERSSERRANTPASTALSKEENRP